MSPPALAPRPDSFAPLPALETGGTVFACALCGSRFTHGGQVCGACPMSNGCDLVRCPDCGYQFPRSSRIADGFAKLWRRWRRRHEP